MYARREEAWRPLNRQRVAAFLRAFSAVLCGDGKWAHRLQVVTHRMMKKTLVQAASSPGLQPLGVYDDEWMWPITLTTF